MGVYPGVGVMNWLCNAGRVGLKCRLTETALRPPQSESEYLGNYVGCSCSEKKW